MKIPGHEYPESHWRRVALGKGMPEATYWARRQAGLNPEEAATRPIKRTGVSPINPDSPRQKALLLGLCDSALSNWRKRHPEDTRSDDAILAEMAERKRAAEEEAELRQRCAEKGHNYWTIRSRMIREGITADEALARPVATRSQRGRRNARKTRGESS